MKKPLFASVISALCIIVWSVGVASAQSVRADRFTLNTGNCTTYSGAGSPEGVVTAPYCSKYFQTDNDGLGATWIKVSGTGNTGWKLIPPFHLDNGVIVFGSTALVRQTAAGSSDAYRSDWYVDYDGATHMDSYNSTGAGAYLPMVLRASTLKVQNPITVTGAVGHPDYAAGLTEWQIDANGNADVRSLITDELRVKNFIADLEQALAGGQIISKGVAVVSADFTMPATSGTGTLTVEDLPSAPNMAVFESGDYVRLRTFSRAAGSLTITDAWGTVSAYADGAGVQTWTFTRLAGASGGAMATGTVISAKSLVLDYGVSGNGYYEVNSIDGAYGANSPYARIVTWATTPTTQTVRTQIGNLKPVTGSLEYGLFAGTYAATNGQYLRASSSAFELHGISLSLWDATTKVMRLEPNSGSPYLSMGSTPPTSYGNNVGVFMGWNHASSVAQMSLYSDASNYFQWNGSKLLVKAANFTLDASGNITASSATLSGAITASSGSIGSFTIGTYLNSGSKATYNDGVAGVHIGSDGIGLGSAFTVSAAGALNASSATISGAITATSGAVGDCSISSGTVSCGGVSLNSGGITLPSGIGSTSQVKWADGSAAYSTVGHLSLSATDTYIRSGGGGIAIDSSNVYPFAGGMDLGTSGSRWGNLYLSGNAYVGSNVYITSPSGVAAGAYPLMRNSDGSLGTMTTPLDGDYICSGGQHLYYLNFFNGIAVNWGCSAYEVTKDDIVSLRAEIAELRAIVSSLTPKLPASIYALTSKEIR